MVRLQFETSGDRAGDLAAIAPMYTGTHRENTLSSLYELNISKIISIK